MAQRHARSQGAALASSHSLPPRLLPRLLPRPGLVQITIGILWSVLFALAIEIIITGPLVLLFLYGVVPALAVRLIEDDVKLALSRRESLARVGSAESGEEDLDRLKDGGVRPSSAFVLATGTSPFVARRVEEQGAESIREMDL